MAEDAAVTVRLPAAVGRQLELRERAHRRSTSAQRVPDLEQVLSNETAAEQPSTVPALGRFGGRRVPRDAEIAEVRARLWSRLRTTRS